MPIFSYKAVDREGRVVRGEIEATDSVHVVEEIHKLHLAPIGVQQKQEAFWDKVRTYLPFGIVDLGSLTMFSRQWEAMIRAGVPFNQILHSLSDKMENRALAKVLQSIDRDIQGGMTLAAAFGRHPRVFSEIYCAMLRIGQSTGTLADVLDQLNSSMEKEVRTNRAIKAALTYPAVVFAVAILAVLSLMVVFVPSFMQIYSSMHITLPLPTRILIGIVNLGGNPFFILIAFAVLVFGVGNLLLYLRTPLGRYHFDLFKLKIPFLGRLMQTLTLARFFRYLGIMYHTGISFVNSLQMSKGIVQNQVYREMLEEAEEAVVRGETLSRHFAQYDIVPPTVVDMLYIGEQTGEFTKLMNKLADMYELEVQSALDNLLSLLEPIMIASLSVIVGFVVIASFLPLYGIIGSLNG